LKVKKNKDKIEARLRDLEFLDKSKRIAKRLEKKRRIE
jgi:hypothetical protein